MILVIAINTLLKAVAILQVVAVDVIMISGQYIVENMVKMVVAKLMEHAITDVKVAIAIRIVVVQLLAQADATLLQKQGIALIVVKV